MLHQDGNLKKLISQFFISTHIRCTRLKCTLKCSLMEGGNISKESLLISMGESTAVEFAYHIQM